VIGDDEYLMGDCEGGGTHGAAARLEAVVPTFEVTSLGAAGGGGCTGQNGAEVNVAFAGTSALLLARALVVTRTHTRPAAR
jgi:hypothetical protein